MLPRAYSGREGMGEERPSSPTVARQISVAGFGAVLLWATAFYWRYYTTRQSRLVFLCTFAVIPLPFLTWLAAICAGKIAGRARRSQRLRFAMWLVIVLAVMGTAALLLPRLTTALHARQRMFSVENVPAKRVAVVFGAGLTPDGRPTPDLAYRVMTAAELYFTGKVEKLLMSGDNRFVSYDEPTAMRKYAMTLGVPGEAIVLDYAGRRTYDTCYRARDVFRVQDVILVTQGYHLPRALYTCNALGIKAIGIAAGQSRHSHVFDHIRECFATALALGDVYIFCPVPILGEPEPVFAPGARLPAGRTACSVQASDSCD
jgi:SanA protein